jgi:BASS family bile acid:Na+ symporter
LKYFNDVNRFYWSGFFGTGISQKKAIAIECGLQNGTLAIFVGTTVFWWRTLH